MYLEILINDEIDKCRHKNTALKLDKEIISDYL